MSSLPHPESSDLRSVDRQLLLALRKGDAIGIGDLTEALGVTATAVRQRIERLLEQGLIEREKLVAGRGRPTFRYRLTVDGHQRAGASPVELVDAMWREIIALPDDAVRSRLLDSVAGRLGQRFAEELNESTRGEESLVTLIANANDEKAVAFERRLHKLSEALVSRHIESEVSHDGELPVLDIGTCPYPSLTSVTDDRAMCRLEEKMFSEALGRPMHLSSCRLDGDACCQFSPTNLDAANNTTIQIKTPT